MKRQKFTPVAGLNFKPEHVVLFPEFFTLETESISASNKPVPTAVCLMSVLSSKHLICRFRIQA